MDTECIERVWMQREYVLGVGVSRVYKVYIEEKHTDRVCVFVERRRYRL
jgi:hypothetical protein